MDVKEYISCDEYLSFVNEMVEYFFIDGEYSPHIGRMAFIPLFAKYCVSGFVVYIRKDNFIDACNECIECEELSKLFMNRPSYVTCAIEDALAIVENTRQEKLFSAVRI